MTSADLGIVALIGLLLVVVATTVLNMRPSVRRQLAAKREAEQKHKEDEARKNLERKRTEANQKTQQEAEREAKEAQHFEQARESQRIHAMFDESFVPNDEHIERALSIFHSRRRSEGDHYGTEFKWLLNCEHPRAKAFQQIALYHESPHVRWHAVEARSQSLGGFPLRFPRPNLELPRLLMDWDGQLVENMLVQCEALVCGREIFYEFSDGQASERCKGFFLEQTQVCRDITGLQQEITRVCCKCGDYRSRVEAFDGPDPFE